MDKPTRFDLALARAWAPAFLAFGLVGSLFLALAVPPFMGPDEPNHFKRAGLTTFGELVADRVLVGGQVSAGGPTDDAIMQSVAPFSHLMGRPDETLSAQEAAAGGAVRWGAARTGQFRNTAAYPPTLYLPQSAAIAIGKAAHAPVTTTLLWARLANAAACLVIGALAIGLAAPRVRPLLFTLLLLPMSLALYATSTQDGAIVAVAALGCALLSRPLGAAGRMTLGRLAVAGLCLGVVAMAKVVYAPLCLMLLAAPARPAHRYGVFAAALLPSLAWTGWMAAAVAVPLINPGSDPAGQLAYLGAHPLAVASIAVQTLSRFTGEYWAAFVGVLGWLDTPLWPPYYLLAAGALAAAAVAGLEGSPARSPAMALACAGALTLAAAAVFAAVYVQWTPVGAPFVEGVQGRYFLPLGAAFSVLLATLGGPAGPARMRRGLKLAVMAFPLLSLGAAALAVVDRFYATWPIPPVWP